MSHAIRSRYLLKSRGDPWLMSLASFSLFWINFDKKITIGVRGGMWFLVRRWRHADLGEAEATNEREIARIREGKELPFRQQRSLISVGSPNPRVGEELLI